MFEKQVILFMIPNGQRWHYLTVRKVSALLRGVTWKNNGHYYCLNCLHSLYHIKTNFNQIKEHVKIKNFAILWCRLEKLKY